MNKTAREMALEKCECSPDCLCTLYHEQVCDGQTCNCWCHKVIPFWERDAVKRVIEKMKGGDKEEMEE